MDTPLHVYEIAAYWHGHFLYRIAQAYASRDDAQRLADRLNGYAISVRYRVQAVVVVPGVTPGVAMVAPDEALVRDTPLIGKEEEVS